MGASVKDKGGCPRRIGLLGGTFNPVHTGHLILAQDAREACGLDEVWLMPCAQPAHKPGHLLAPAAMRAAMVERAIAADEHLCLSCMELEREGISYAVDTVRQLRAEHPAVAWSFIIGADTLPELVSWRQIEELLTLCAFVTMARPGQPPPAALRDRIRLPDPWPDRLVEGIFPGHLVDISSSEVRKRVAEGRSIRYLVPDGVADYIRDQGLYRTGV
jgi:nicotinate-nucleotide adenylyltransferase